MNRQGHQLAVFKAVCVMISFSRRLAGVLKAALSLRETMVMKDRESSKSLQFEKLQLGMTLHNNLLLLQNQSILIHGGRNWFRYRF